MEVIVSRSGGLAGLRLTWQVDVDEQPDADDWLLLIERVPWSRPPRPSPGADRFVYRIRCEPGREAALPEREATVPEGELTGPWRELVDRVRDASEPSPGLPPAPGGSRPDAGGAGRPR